MLSAAEKIRLEQLRIELKPSFGEVVEVDQPLEMPGVPVEDPALTSRVPQGETEVVGNLTPEETARMRQLKTEIDVAQADQEKQIFLEQDAARRKQVVQTLNANISGLAPRDFAAMREDAQLPEASLGTGNRALMALEPLESNRIAFLAQRFGDNNVVVNEDGEVFVKTGRGKDFLPVNQAGLTQADLADFAGALPETALTAAGAMLGLGVASVPAAVLGGALGSLFRQGLSASIGEVPQVAEVGERAVETGLSGLLAGGGQFAGQKLKSFAKEGVKKAFPGAGKSMGRAAKIIKEQDLGTPTLGQKLGPSSTLGKVEKDLSEIPFVGRKIRKQFEEQAEKVVKTLKKDIGDFSSESFSPEAVGHNIKKLARGHVSAKKKMSTELFDETIELFGSETAIDGKKLAGQINRLGTSTKLLGKNGVKVPYNPKSGMDRESFELAQRTLLDVVDSLNESLKTGIPSKGIRKGGVTLKEVDAIRKSITKTLNSKQVRETFAAKNIKNLEDVLLGTVEKELSKVDKSIGKNFKQARSLWKNFRDSETLANSLGLGDNLKKEISDELVSRSIFKNVKVLNQVESLIGKDAVRESAENFLAKSVRENMTGEEFIRTSTVLRALKKNESVYKRVFGAEKYRKLTDLLEFDKNLKIMPNPSGTATKQIRTSAKEILTKGIFLKGIVGFLNGSQNIPTGLMRNLARTAPQAQKFKRKSAFKARMRSEKKGEKNERDQPRRN